MESRFGSQQKLPQRGGIKALTNTRAVYDDIAIRAAKNGSKIKPVLSYLRLEASLQQTAQIISWNVLQNQQNAGLNQTVTEQRLQLNDSFTVLQMGFYVAKIGTSSTWSALSNTDFARMRFNTFPDPKLFTGTNEAANLYNLYNGALNLTIIDKTIIKNYPMIKFYRVPLAQQTYAGYSGGPAQVAGFDSENYGMASMTPNITIEGSQNIQFNLNMPTSLDTSGTGSSNVAILFLYGFLQQNGAKFNA